MVMLGGQGKCWVTEPVGRIRFQLYFNGADGAPGRLNEGPGEKVVREDPTVLNVSS